MGLSLVLRYSWPAFSSDRNALNPTMQCVQGLRWYKPTNFPFLHCRRSSKNEVKVQDGLACSYRHRVSLSLGRKTHRVVSGATFGSQGKGTPEEEEDHEAESSECPGKEAFEHDPEVADILMGTFDDPEKMRKRIEDRVRKKRKHILQPKIGSSVPMKVVFNNFDFSDSYVWIEFYHAPMEKDVELLGSVTRSWYVLGRLGGYNSMNMQLTQLSLDAKPSYDSVEASNAMSPSLYNIGDLEVQDNLARFWVDLGTSDALMLDILINTLTCLSSDYIGIKHLVFGGKHWGDWKEGMTCAEAGYKVCKI